MAPIQKVGCQKCFIPDTWGNNILCRYNYCVASAVFFNNSLALIVISLWHICGPDIAGKTSGHCDKT